MDTWSSHICDSHVISELVVIFQSLIFKNLSVLLSYFVDLFEPKFKMSLNNSSVNLDSSDASTLVIDEGNNEPMNAADRRADDVCKNGDNVGRSWKELDENQNSTTGVAQTQDDAKRTDNTTDGGGFIEDMFSENEDTDAYVEPGKFEILSGDIYKCKECSVCFDHLGSLKRHLPHCQSRDSDLVVQGFGCNVCKNTFYYKSDYERHRQTHGHVTQVLRCPQCDRPFALESHLKLHMSIHGGRKSHTCQLCDQAFVFEFNLTKHMSTHALEKPHRCKICSKTFTFKANLER